MQRGDRCVTSVQSFLIGKYVSKSVSGIVFSTGAGGPKQKKKTTYLHSYLIYFLVQTKNYLNKAIAD